MTVRKYIPANADTQRAAIEASFPGLVAEQQLARIDRGLRSDVQKLRAKKEAANPKAAFDALFKQEEQP